MFEEVNSLRQGENHKHPKEIRRGGARLGVLAVAEGLRNISPACRRAEILRHFYEIKEAIEKYGADGLALQPRRAQQDSGSAAVSANP